MVQDSLKEMEGGDNYMAQWGKGSTGTHNQGLSCAYLLLAVCDWNGRSEEI